MEIRTKEDMVRRLCQVCGVRYVSAEQDEIGRAWYKAEAERVAKLKKEIADKLAKENAEAKAESDRIASGDSETNPI